MSDHRLGPPVIGPLLGAMSERIRRLAGARRMGPKRRRARDFALSKVAALFREGSADFPAEAVDALAVLIEQFRHDDVVCEAAERALLLVAAGGPEDSLRRRALERLERPDARRRTERDIERSVLRASLLGELGERPGLVAAMRAVDWHACSSPDLHLLAAAAAAGPQERLAHLDRAFRLSSGLGIARAEPGEGDALPRLEGIAHAAAPPPQGPTVSVILCADGEGDTLAALDSVSAQTWPDLEILVVVRAGDTSLAQLVAEAARRDARIRTVMASPEAGPVALRNAGLAHAGGDLFLWHGSREWSHPERIRRQADDLLSARGAVAALPSSAKATVGLAFLRRPFEPRIIGPEPAGALFRRAEVQARIGCLDEVRADAADEYLARVAATFGAGSQVGSAGLLMVDFGCPSARGERGPLETGREKVGARRVYQRRYTAWHASGGGDAGLRLEQGAARRPFPVPQVLATGRPLRDRFDAVLISDFRHVGGTSASNHQELLAQVRAGIRTAVLQVYRFGYNPNRGVHPPIQAMIDAGAVTELVHGDEIDAGVAVIRFPAIFATPQRWLPSIRTRSVRVVVNQPPRLVAGDAPFYSVEGCRANIADWLGQPGDWVPIGPQVRDALVADGADRHLSGETWENIIDLDAWAAPRDGWRADRPVIGRHGRDSREKWPSRASDILAAYPDDGSVVVRVLGGADVPAATLGRMPDWEVLPFNAVEPRDFLATIDFFVFFPHEGRIEAFGRTIIEAMASGCLVILPPVFESLFGDAAVYCCPADVQSTVRRFHASRDDYIRQISHARSVVRDRFSFERHVARMRRAMCDD